MVEGESGLKIVLMIAHTPHTSPSDAEDMALVVSDFRPDILSPWEAARSDAQLAKLEQEELAHLIGGGKKEQGFKTGFKNDLLERLRNDYVPTGWKPRVHYIERYDTDTDALRQAQVYAEAIAHRKEALRFAEEGKWDEASAEMGLYLDCYHKDAIERIINIAENIGKLPRVIAAKYPELAGKGKVRVLMYMGSVYSLLLGEKLKTLRRNGLLEGVEIRKVFPSAHGKTYSFLTKNAIMRAMMSKAAKPTKEQLKRALVEELLESELRDVIPRSEKRFTVCRELAAQLLRHKNTSMKEIRRFSGDKSRKVQSAAARNLLHGRK